MAPLFPNNEKLPFRIVFTKVRFLDHSQRFACFISNNKTHSCCVAGVISRRKKNFLSCVFSASAKKTNVRVKTTLTSAFDPKMRSLERVAYEASHYLAFSFCLKTAMDHVVPHVYWFVNNWNLYLCSLCKWHFFDDIASPAGRRFLIVAAHCSCIERSLLGLSQVRWSVTVSCTRPRPSLRLSRRYALSEVPRTVWLEKWSSFFVSLNSPHSTSSGSHREI